MQNARSRIKTATAYCTIVTSVTLLLLGLIPASWELRNRTLEMLSNFRHQYLLISIGVLAISIFLRRWKLIALAILSVSVCLEFVLPWYISTPGLAIPASEHLRIISCNVQFSNKQHERLLKVVADQKPDVLVLQEVSRDWLEALKPLDEGFPFHRFQVERNGWLIAIYSKFPLRHVTSDNFEVAHILAHIRFGDTRTAILTTHLYTPTNNWKYANRNDGLTALATIANNTPGPKIVIGDFNTTIWSPFSIRFAEQTGLFNARKGFGPSPSWPSIAGPMGIPIDQCFVSDGIRIENLRLGENFGSDHLPLIVDLEVAKSGLQARSTSPGR
ncbi:MAG TPA: endonuclease/exonuclease/phosphatase family protein [Acidobacteriota bacterium]|nr:endonuclease/exonuclease/phosphatase family protein [Acidobacteriota bacterium]